LTRLLPVEGVIDIWAVATLGAGEEGVGWLGLSVAAP
jgi:hypothetical protein